MTLWVVLGVAAGGCGSGGDGSEKSAATTTVTASVTTHGRYHYPRVIVDNFMKSCTNGRQNRVAYCGCTLDKLSNDASVQDFARIGLSGGRLPPRMKRLIRQAAVACADKL